MAASAVLNIVKRASGLLSSEWKHNRAGQEVKWDFLPTAAAAAAGAAVPLLLLLLLLYHSLGWHHTLWRIDKYSGGCIPYAL